MQRCAKAKCDLPRLSKRTLNSISPSTLVEVAFVDLNLSFEVFTVLPDFKICGRRQDLFAGANPNRLLGMYPVTNSSGSRMG